MKPVSRLALHEETLLLALHDDAGTVSAGTTYPFAVGAAVLAELLMRARIVVVESVDVRYVEVINPRPTGDDFLDECLDRISSGERRPLVGLITELATLGGLKHRVARQLCDRGILREDEGRFMLLFSQRVYPESDPSPEREIVERLRLAIFVDDDDLDARTVALVALARQGALLEVVFDRKALADHAGRLDWIVDSALGDKASPDTLRALRAAIEVARTVPTVASSRKARG